MNHRVVLGSLALGLALVSACNTDRGSPSAQPPSTAPASAVASAPPATPVTPLKLLVKSTTSIDAAGVNGQGVLLAGRTGLALVHGKLEERPGLLRALENPRWSRKRMTALSVDVAVIDGERDPESLQLSDEMVYGENRQTSAESTVFRVFLSNAWSRTSALDAGEKLGAVGRFKGRIAAVIELDYGQDYKFKLLAGKPGIAFPSPGQVDKPKEETAAADSHAEPSPPVPTASAEGNAAPSAGESAPAAPASAAGGPSSPVPAASAAVAPNAPPSPLPAESAPAAELNPNLPHPPASSGCVTRIVPRAFDGLESGEAMVIGPACPGQGELWAEVWATGKGKGSYERVPGMQPGPNLVLVMSAPGTALLAAIGTRNLVERTPAGWRTTEPPGSGNIVQIASAPGGRVWLVVGGQVYWRDSGQTWKALVLPAGVTATAVIPSDGDIPFVIADKTLWGPEASSIGEVVEAGAGTTSLCTEPYVVVKAKVERDKKKNEAEIARVQAAGAQGVVLYFGYRGMLGESNLEAKVADMGAARKLAQALGNATILCGAPRGPQEIKL